MADCCPGWLFSISKPIAPLPSSHARAPGTSRSAAQQARGLQEASGSTRRSPGQLGDRSLRAKPAGEGLPEATILHHRCLSVKHKGGLLLKQSVAGAAELATYPCKTVKGENSP